MVEPGSGSLSRTSSSRRHYTYYVCVYFGGSQRGMEGLMRGESRHVASQVRKWGWDGRSRAKMHLRWKDEPGKVVEAFPVLLFLVFRKFFCILGNLKIVTSSSTA